MAVAAVALAMEDHGVGHRQLPFGHERMQWRVAGQDFGDVHGNRWGDAERSGNDNSGEGSDPGAGFVVFLRTI